ncbi:hypothetical protein DUU53_25585 [Salmonella enterica subsp. enterica serovar Berlin]|nr:fimbria/pilus periplasmic chaperone [Salmonella enterica]EBY0806368.1 hypothetical protein [Salmonella enterica subsp. enterica serovar Berlin]
MWISSIFLRFVFNNFILLLLTSFSFEALAGGIALGATRVIYPMDTKQVSLAVTNSDKKNRFLIQSWIDSNNMTKSNDFILTPPLFVSKPESENTLRIMYVGSELPQDRETVFWLNSKAIPAIERESIKGKNVLQIAILSRIKLFVRPANLPSTPAEAPAQLRFSRKSGGLRIDNPSPYYVTLVNFHLGQKKLPNTMIAPKSSSSVISSDRATGTVTFQTVNDYGANTPIITVKLD